MLCFIKSLISFAIIFTILKIYRKIRKKRIKRERAHKEFEAAFKNSLNDLNVATEPSELKMESDDIDKLSIQDNEFRDDFHTGRFHFASDVQNGIIDNIKYALAKNDQDALYKFLQKIKGAKDPRKIKTKKISSDGVITIGFFCNYMNSGIFRNTIGVYNNYFDKIKWVGCHINADHIVTGSSCPIISFADSESAIAYSDLHFDFVIDADFLLRPKNFYEILKRTSSHTLNYYNFSCSSYNNQLDAFLVVEGLEVSKYPPSEKVISLPAQGSWQLSEQKDFAPDYICDILFIGDQFKYGKKFLELYKTLSDDFKIIFLGLRNNKHLLKHLKEYGWKMKNVHFHDRIDDETEFRYFLTKAKTVIDTPDYSGGSSTLYAIRSGTPVLAFNGKYLLDGMSSAFLKEMGLKELCFDSVEQMKTFLTSKTDAEFKEYSKYIAKKTSDSLYFQPDKFLPIFYEKLVKSFQ